jgi:hypothetical protein
MELTPYRSNEALLPQLMPRKNSKADEKEGGKSGKKEVKKALEYSKSSFPTLRFPELNVGMAHSQHSSPISESSRLDSQKKKYFITEYSDRNSLLRSIKNSPYIDVKKISSKKDDEDKPSDEKMAQEFVEYALQIHGTGI